MKLKNKKKIFVLAAFGIALCIVAGIVGSMNMGKAGSGAGKALENPTKDPNIGVTGIPVETKAVEVPAQEMAKEETVIVAEINTEEENVPAKAEETEAAATADKDSNGTKKASEGKPKTKEEAVPPAEPPKAKEGTETTNPEKKPEYTEKEVKPSQKKNTPKSGDKRSDGAIYVPGFGWVEDSGPNVQIDVELDLSGNQVGEMD